MLNAGEGYSEVLAFGDKISPTQLNNHIVWYEHANSLDNLGMYEEAVIAYQQALKIKADFQDAWISLGAVLCDHFHKYEEALECFDTALRIDYLDDFAWYNRGNALEQLKRYDDALACYNIVLKLNPDDENAWYSRGWVLYEMGKYHDAIASYDEALIMKPLDDSTWYNKACCYAVLGNVEKTIECLQAATKLSPNQYHQMVKIESDFDIIRNDARFQEFML